MNETPPLSQDLQASSSSQRAEEVPVRAGEHLLKQHEVLCKHSICEMMPPLFMQ